MPSEGERVALNLNSTWMFMQNLFPIEKVHWLIYGFRLFLYNTDLLNKGIFLEEREFWKLKNLRGTVRVHLIIHFLAKLLLKSINKLLMAYAKEIILSLHYSSYLNLSDFRIYHSDHLFPILYVQNVHVFFWVDDTTVRRHSKLHRMLHNQGICSSHRPLHHVAIDHVILKCIDKTQR